MRVHKKAHGLTNYMGTTENNIYIMDRTKEVASKNQSYLQYTVLDEIVMGPHFCNTSSTLSCGVSF